VGHFDERGERLAAREPDHLTDGEWRVLINYRLNQLEARVNSFSKALWTNIAAVGVGIIVYLLTTNLGN
jgi:hypothetical protein